MPVLSSKQQGWRLRAARYSLLLGVSTTAIVWGHSPARAQSSAPAPETVIVTGTRVQGMTAADSATPITVLGSDALSAGVGTTDVRQALGELVPSFTAQQYANDTAEFSLSASLRGLSPNDTLVLVDGERRHYSGNLHVDAGFGAGSSAPDISLIPESAIDHVEVLLDGAAAQYGTDAIGGVVNIILKKQPSGGLISTTMGQNYSTMGGTADMSANMGIPLASQGFVNMTVDHQTHDFTFTSGPDSRLINGLGQPAPVGTVGTAPNAAGIIACSGGNCIPTTGPYAVSNDFNYPNSNRISGDGMYQLTTAEVNAGYNVTPDIQLYGFGTIGYRIAKSNQNFRLPNQVIASPGSNAPCSASNLQGYNTAQTASGSGACAIGVSTTGSASGAGVALLAGSVAATPGVNSAGQIISSGQAGTLFTPGELVQYPRGMQPEEGLIEEDYQTNVGARFNVLGWNLDADVGFGKDIDKVSTLNSGNRSLFIDTHTTPSNFYDGQFQASQFTGNLDAVQGFNVGLASPLNVAVGAEARQDTYAIFAGDPSSYYKEGPQSFPGFAPATAGFHSRKNYAGYIDLAVAPIESITLDIAGRSEYYTDFGSANIGKATARWDITDQYAIRGTISTGFRAPTLQEEYYSAVNVSPTSATVQLPADSAAAKVLGLPNLKPETSVQYSAGIVAKPFDNLSATLDLYSIAMGNRIVASSTVNSVGGSINTPLVTTAINDLGVSLDPTATMQGVTSFLNGLDTLTEGVDLMAQYLTDFDQYGTTTWTLSGNYNTTKVANTAPAPAILLAANPSATFFNYESLYNYQHQTPAIKIGLMASWGLGDWGVTLRETFYGPQHTYTSPNSGGELIPFDQAGVGLTDLEARYNITDQLQFTLGGNNLFGIKPDTIPIAPSICPAPGVVLIGAATCVLGPNNASGEGETASNGATLRSPFGTAWNPNGGYYYARLTFKF